MENKRKATLRLFLKDEILAYELATTIDLINETYTSLRWLELAELHSAPGPYDDSRFASDEFLRVPRADIGTPNLVDLYGLYGTLHDTLAYLFIIGGVRVIPKLANEFIDLRTRWIESQLKKIELQQKQNPEWQRIEIQKRNNEVEKGRLENEKLRRELQEMDSGKRLWNRFQKRRGGFIDWARLQRRW